MLEFEIIVDHGETANKCTIMPLIYRPDFKILRGRDSRALNADILLHPEGRVLTHGEQSLKGVTRLAAIDCVWRRLQPILDGLETPHPQLVAIPADFATAYPRTSKKDFDPEGGLATIEALFIAAALLGHWDLSLLREYFFAETFLELNEAVFRRYGVVPLIEKPLFRPLRARTSQTRRIGRGRIPKDLLQKNEAATDKIL